jgi:hypothetical protein
MGLERTDEFVEFLLAMQDEAGGIARRDVELNGGVSKRVRE